MYNVKYKKLTYEEVSDAYANDDIGYVIENFIPAAVYTAKKIRCSSDAIQEAVLKLCLVAQDYDPDNATKCPFYSYAVPKIRGHLIDYLYNSKLVRVPRTSISTAFLVKDVLRKHNDSIPDTIKELQETSKGKTFKLLKSSDIWHHLKTARISNQIPIPISTFEETDEETFRILPKELHVNDMEEFAKVHSVRTLLDTLTEKERKVLIWYYGIGGEEPLTHKQIGKKLNFSASLISKVRNQALKKIRKRIGGKDGHLPD